MIVPKTQTMIPLQSPAGQSLWGNCTIKNQGMVDYFVPNDNALLNGPASLALLLNAINVVYRLKYSNLEAKEDQEKFMDKLYNSDERFLITKEELLSLKVTKKLFSDIDVSKNRMTLLDINTAAMKLGFGTVLNYANNESMSEEQRKEFEKISQGDGNRYIMNNSESLQSFVSEKIGIQAPSGIIANYNSKALGLEDDSGVTSFGTLAAFHEGRVLVMDGGKMGEAWVNVEDLYEAMTHIDPNSQVPMGMIAIYELL